MDFKLLLVLSVVVVSTVLVEGHRGGRGGSTRPWRQRRHRPTYFWAADLGDRNIAAETAVVSNDGNQVLLKSISSNLTAAGFTKSSTLYDFSGEHPLMFIRLVYEGRRYSQCYMANTTLTYEHVLDTLAARNGTITPLGHSVSLDGSSAAIDREEARAFITAHPTLRGVCKTGKIVRLSDTPAPASETTQVVQILNLDSVVSLTVPLPAASSRRGHWGGQRGRGRGRH